MGKHCQGVLKRPKQSEREGKMLSLLWFARHGHNLTGVSPERGLIAASAQPRTKCQWRHWVRRKSAANHWPDGQKLDTKAFARG